MGFEWRLADLSFSLSHCDILQQSMGCAEVLKTMFGKVWWQDRKSCPTFYPHSNLQYCLVYIISCGGRGRTWLLQQTCFVRFWEFVRHFLDGGWDELCQLCCSWCEEVYEEASRKDDTGIVILELASSLPLSLLHILFLSRVYDKNNFLKFPGPEKNLGEKKKLGYASLCLREWKKNPKKRSPPKKRDGKC